MQYLEILNSAVLVILAALFFVQNKVITSVKSFFDIFDMEKVKQYVKMNEETVLMKASLLASNDEKVRDIMNEVTKEKFDDMAEFYKETMGNEYAELFHATQHLIKNCLKNKEDEQLRFINEFLPNVKPKIMPVLFPESDDKKTS